jgi:hypothetical protein
MSLTFPRAMPLAAPSQQSFEPSAQYYGAPENGGTVGGVQSGFTRWIAQWTLGALSQAGSDEWRAFVASLNTKRLFLGRDYDRPYPNAYLRTGFAGLTKAAGGAFDGAVTSWSQSVSGGVPTLSLTNLPVGFVFANGDYVDFRWTTGGVLRRSLVRSVDTPQTANGSGNLSFVCEPAVPSITPGGAAAHLDQPACLMRLNDAQPPLGGLARRRVVGGSIAATQVLLP